MADVNNLDILRVGAGLNFQGIYDVVNVFHILAELDVGKTWAEVTVYLESYMNNIYSTLKTPLSDTIGTNVLSVANVTQDTTIGAIAWNPTWAGAESGECTAPGVCCFSWGRTYKPRVQIRKYWGVFGEVNVVDGVWTSTVQTACTAAMEEHIDRNLMTTGVYFTGVAYNRTLETYQAAVSADSSAEPAYQRRRKRGRGS